MPPDVGSSADVRSVAASTQFLSARGLSDEDIPSLGRLKDLKHISFATGYAVTEARITDRGLSELRKLELPKLNDLFLGWCDQITDAGLEEVAQINSLQRLMLPACPYITDAGLAKLNKSKSLTYLDLRGCPLITDQGIQQLAVKPDWKEIHLGGCPKVTPDGVAKLEAALPNAFISKDDKEWNFHTN